MNAPDKLPWINANQHQLAAEFAQLRRRFGGAQTDCDTALVVDPQDGLPACSEPAAVDDIAALFGLSAFERSVLLMTAGVELDTELAQMLPRPTFGHALASLPGAHWSALTPAAPLRAWKLVSIDGDSLTQGRLRIDERILHALVGIHNIDSRLRSVLRAVRPSSLLAASHRAVARELAAAVLAPGDAQALVELSGSDREGQLDIAAHIAQAKGRQLLVTSQADLPSAPGEQWHLATLIQRELGLLPAALLIECSVGEKRDADVLVGFLRHLPSMVFLSGPQTLPLGRLPVLRTGPVDRPSAAEQVTLWRQALGSDAAPELKVAALQVAGQLRLSAADIERQARGLTPATAAGLQGRCRSAVRPSLDGLAQAVQLRARWADLVLPAASMALLQALTSQMRHRARVHGDWGFAARGPRGLGIGALFCGASGVGKSLACEVLAQELGLDLYRIDLSALVSKYIGETEKNLRRLFDAAETSGAILMFDEADALFGKRSEVKDSHDRYANIEVSYLLQRMECYQGLSVLTTNMRSALDPAFTRRLRFVIQFPFPDQQQRQALWRQAFPAALPQEGIDYPRLATLQMSGGQIHNVVRNAAFLAADADSPVTMALLAQAARIEGAKHEHGQGEPWSRIWP